MLSLGSGTKGTRGFCTISYDCMKIYHYLRIKFYQFFLTLVFRILLFEKLELNFAYDVKRDSISFVPLENFWAVGPSFPHESAIAVMLSIISIHVGVVPGLFVLSYGYSCLPHGQYHTDRITVFHPKYQCFIWHDPHHTPAFRDSWDLWDCRQGFVALCSSL